MRRSRALWKWIGTLSLLIVSYLAVFGQGNNIPSYFENVWLCLDNSASLVDDYTTARQENFQCRLEVEYTDTTVIIRANGIPSHDYESTLGCCASAQNYEWTIPLLPTDDTDGQLTPAPERGPIAFAVNGVAIFGPEDGPGGDAVALENGLYVENRQQIDLGICGGHSGPGGQYHYHWDANCMHWHPDTAKGQQFSDYSFDQLARGAHSPIIGFAFDGYPIYGIYGWNHAGNVKEMTSSYRLKTGGANGYNGIDDWEYVEGMGDLDECNGHFGPTPEVPEGIYHYHSTRLNGAGSLGFPYFLLCYHGIPDERNFARGRPPR